jgi:hypothetical protein
LMKVSQSRCSLHSLYQRFSSRGEADYADKLLSAIAFSVWRTSRNSGEKQAA